MPRAFNRFQSCQANKCLEAFQVQAKNLEAFQAAVQAKNLEAFQAAVQAENLWEVNTVNRVNTVNKE
jgi:hypothetical protein